MTKRDAMEILIRHAAQNAGGVGCGIRPLLTERARCEVRDAIVQIWGDVFCWPISSDELRGMGLPSLESHAAGAQGGKP